MSNKNFNRRDFLKTVGGAAAATAFYSTTGFAAGMLSNAFAKTGKRPNIVFVLADDQRADMMSCSGNPYVKTPHFDRMAKEGVMFENAFVNVAVCSPSRACFLTGKNPHQVGAPCIIHNAQTFHRTEIPFPQRLHDAGYSTAHFGKWHLGEGHVAKPGYDVWRGFYAVGPYFNPTLSGTGETKQYKGFTDDVLSELAADYIKESAKKDKPFCVFVGLKAPHLHFEYPPRHEHIFDGKDIPKPDSYDEDYVRTGKPAFKNLPCNIKLKEFIGGLPLFDNSWDKYIKSYYRSSQSLDDSLGTIMKAVDESGEADNTILIYTSDHGYSLGEHGLTEKHYAYEKCIRIPMLVRYPRMIKPGIRRKEMVLNMDVAPTLLDLADVPIPKDVEGKSWRPLLESKNEKEHDFRDDFLYYLEGLNLAIRTKRYKLIQWPNTDFSEFYDLKKDPDEMKNLINNPAYSKIKKRLENRIEEYKKETDLRPKVDMKIAEPYFLGPFDNAQEPEILKKALAISTFSNTPIKIGEKTFSWNKVPSRKRNSINTFKNAEWIWFPEGEPLQSAPTGTIYFKKTIEIPKDRKIKKAEIITRADNRFIVYVNEKKVGNGVGWESSHTIDLTKILRNGENKIVIEAKNDGKTASPAGLVASLCVEFNEGALLFIKTNKKWKAFKNKNDKGIEAKILGKYGCAPWGGNKRGVDIKKLCGNTKAGNFLIGFPIEVLGKKDPYVRVTLTPVRTTVTGYANGKPVYSRGNKGNYNPFNFTLNPPLKPGNNSIVFKGKTEQLPSLSINVSTYINKIKIPGAIKSKVTKL